MTSSLFRRPDPWRDPLGTLRQKWREIPISARGRAQSPDLLTLDDASFMRAWSASRADMMSMAIKGWYYRLYDEWFRDKRILEIGSGAGIDACEMTRRGATVTAVDIVQSNLDIVDQAARLQGLHVRTLLLDRFDRLADLPRDFDAVIAVGSLHHAPAISLKPEFDLLANRLRCGGRFLMLAYPKARWEAEGSLPFDQWGKRTDGDATPWAEWYDAQKLIEQLRPASFALVFYNQFWNDAMCWIDLVKAS